MKNNYEEILSYAKQLKEKYPSISADEMKKVLSAKFIGGKDVLLLANMGIIATPFHDFLAMVSILYNSLLKVITQDKEKLVKIQEDIDRAVMYLLTLK